MGSFSVSCALTGITLSNQPAVLIPLAPARWPGGEGARSSPSPIGGAYVCTNEGACGLFGPLALPILGRVGDYGDLEDYEEDANVRFLKVRFGDQFDDFIEGCTRGGRTKLTDRLARKIAKSRFKKEYATWDGTLSGCWIAREAWDLFSTRAWNENGTPRATIGDDGWLDPQNLKTMGFVSGPEDKATALAIIGPEGDRYNTPYTHKELPEFIVWCDEHMSSRASYKGKKAEIGLTFQPFLKGLKKLGLKLPESARTAVANTSIFRGHLIEARNSQTERVEMSDRHERFLKEHPQARFNRIAEGSTECTQVYCSRDRFSKSNGKGKHFHVTLTGKQVPEEDMSETALRGEVESFRITPCDGKSGDHKEVWERGMQFTPAVWDALKVAGWKPRKREVPSGSSSDPYMRGFPEEALELYRYRRGSMLSDKFLPAVEALLCFESNMHAANKMLTPTLNGWQCGNNATQRRVAQMALKLVAAREDRHRR